MDQLENQVSDLRYLTQNALSPLAETLGSNSPVSATIGINSAHHVNHDLNGNATSDGGGSGAKRKSSDDSHHARQQRSKRNRYISIACNECKRRKIKCNGETPCQRCGNLNLQCLYAPNCCSNSVKDSDEFKQMASTVARLHEQVETLFSNMNALRSETLRLAPITIQDRMLPLPSGSRTPSSSNSIPPLHRPDLVQLRQQPGFRGPTSAHFTLDVAKNTLHKMGYGSLGDGVEENGLAPDDTPTTSPILAPHTAELERRLPADPLWDFDKDEMIRLCRVYEEEVNIMYPVLLIETIVSHLKTLTTWLEAARKNSMCATGGAEGGIKDVRSLQLKMVLCCALVVEEHANSERANKLFDSVRPHTDRMLMSDPANTDNLPLLAMAGFYFLRNDEILAWRTMGQVCRLCIELGLHRHENIVSIQDEEARMNIIHTFWVAYVLDRRWSFAAGLPYSLQDDEMDPQLPYPDAHPYLVALISYGHLCARVWKLNRHFEPSTELRPNEIEELDRQIKQWYTGVPAETQLELSDWESMPRYLSPQPQHTTEKEYDVQRLQIWTYLRLNQIRSWLYTPVLHTHGTIIENLHFAERAVKLAKNTITYLTHLNNTTNLYRRIQVFYHQFLTPAIAILFLASCHAPVNFSATCRDEFYMALELVKDLSAKSWVSKRLWRTIRSLREVAPRVGLAEDAHSSAALTMAGLATGHVPSTSTVGPTPPSSTTSTFSRPPTALPNPPPLPSSAPELFDGLQISTEMSKIFEGYLNGFPAGPVVEQVDDDRPPAASFGVGVGEGSVYPHFRDES